MKSKSLAAGAVSVVIACTAAVPATANAAFALPTKSGSVIGKIIDDVFGHTDEFCDVVNIGSMVIGPDGTFIWVPENVDDTTDAVDHICSFEG